MVALQYGNFTLKFDLLNQTYLISLRRKSDMRLILVGCEYVGKTTLAIKITAALTQALNPTRSENQVCLFDLDLRLPTITGILNSHPQKTFYDLFETLANRTYQVDFLQSLYRILVSFKSHINGETTPKNKPLLQKNSEYLKYYQLT